MNFEISVGRLKDLYNICQKKIDWSCFYSLNDDLDKLVCAEFDYVMNWNVKNLCVPGLLKSLDLSKNAGNIIKHGIEPIQYFFEYLDGGLIEDDGSQTIFSHEEATARLEKFYVDQDIVSLTAKQAYEFTLLCRAYDKVDIGLNSLTLDNKITVLIDYAKCSEKHNITIDGFFDSKYYLGQNQDVLESGMNPLIHFLSHGLDENRIAWPETLTEANQYRDICEVLYSALTSQESSAIDIGNSYSEFKMELKKDGYTPSILFNPEYVKQALGNDSISFEIWFQEFLSRPITAGPIWDLFSHLLDSESESRVVVFREISDILARLNFISEHSCMTFLCLVREGNSISDLIRKLRDFSNSKYQAAFSSLFDIEYLEQKTNMSFASQFEAFNYWYENRNEIGSCTPVFNEKYYTERYKDISEHPWPFFHFFAYGRFEGRIPHYAVDEWYYSPEFQKHRECIISKEINTFGSLGRVFPALEVFSRKVNSAFKDKGIEGLNLTESKFLASIGPIFEDYKRLMFFFHIVDIRSIVRDGEGLDLKNLLSPSDETSTISYLFDFVIAKDQLSRSNAESFLSVFNSWLDENLSGDISPTPVFDPVYYRQRNRDLISLPGNSFEHYVFHGQYEGRSPHPFIDPLWVKNTYGISGYSLLDETIYASIPRKPSQAIAPLSNAGPGFGELYELCKDTMNSGSFSFEPNSKLQLALKKVNQIEPLIKVWEPSRVFTTMPYNIDSYLFIRDLPELVGTADILIFRDAINFGGADVVLGEVYRALKSSQKGKSIKVISLGSVDYDVLPERGIDSSDVVDLSAVLNGANEFNANQVVYDIIQGSGCSSLLNLNCGALWNCIEDYGKILSTTCDLYGYFFCDDKDEFGNVTGYPAKYLASTARHLKKIYFDSEYLLSCISRRGVIGNSLTNKIVVLPTPLRHSGFSEKPVKASGIIAWAGRFDRQKRPDILIEVAKRMPEYQFKVWGKAVLDRTPYQWDTAENIQLMGLYDSEQDLLNEGCSLLLYTSEWDGVPTLLLKMHELGLPVVASDVGGVSEVIPEDCLITEVDNIDLYVDAISAFYSAYDKRIASYQTFVDDLCSVRSTEEFEKGLVV